MQILYHSYLVMLLMQDKTAYAACYRAAGKACAYLFLKYYILCYRSS